MLQVYRVASRRRNVGQPTSNDNSTKNNELEPDDIGIAGVRQLMDPSYSLCEKCFWLTALLLCCAVCLYQAITLTAYYLSNPISIEIQMLRNDTINFPAITICPASLSYNFTLALDFFRRRQCDKHGIKHENCTLSKLHSELNITMEDVWQEHKISPDNFEINSTCGTSLTNQNSPCEHGRKKYSMLHEYVSTIYGTCLYAAQREPMAYKGPETYISFKTTNKFPLTGPYNDFWSYNFNINPPPPSIPMFTFPSYNYTESINCTNCNFNDYKSNMSNYRPTYEIFDDTHKNTPNTTTNSHNNIHTAFAGGGGFSSADKTWKDEIPFSIFLHEPHVISRHDASYLAESVFQRYFMELKISVKEYRYLNTKENPCTDEETFTECRNKCLDEKLQQQIPCKLPFIKGSNKSQCLNSIESLEDAYEKAMNVYRTMKLSDCSCARKCNDIMYIVMSDVGFVTSDWKTTFHLYYPINIHEIVIENFAYSLANLLSDIAGAIGFYMGVCILGFIEIFDIIIKKKVRTRFQRKTNDVELGPTRF